MSVGLRCRLTRPTKNGQGIDYLLKDLDLRLLKEVGDLNNE